MFFLLAVLVSGLLPASIMGGTALAAATQKICGEAPSHAARCFATAVTDGGTAPLVSATPKGYGPASFKAVYGNRGLASAHVGIVVA
jgi:hypothetical protein